MSSRKGISTRRNSVCIKTMDTNTKCMHVEFVSSRLFGHLKEGTTREIDTYIHSSPRSANYFKDSQSVLVIFFKSTAAKMIQIICENHFFTILDSQAHRPWRLYLDDDKNYSMEFFVMRLF